MFLILSCDLTNDSFVLIADILCYFRNIFDSNESFGKENYITFFLPIKK